MISALLAIRTQDNRGVVSAPGQAPSNRSDQPDGGYEPCQFREALVAQPRVALNRATIGPLGRDDHRAPRARAAVLQLSVRSLLALHLQTLAGEGMERVGDHDTVWNHPARRTNSGMR